MLIKQQSIASSHRTGISSLAAFAIVFAAAATPLPTAWGSFSLIFLLIAFLAQSPRKETWQRIRGSGPAWAAIGLLAALALGMLYGATPFPQAFSFWTKYLKLLVIPIIIGLAPNDVVKRWAINAALAAIVLSVLVSYARYFGWINSFADPNQPYLGFQNRITFGLYTSIASYIFATRAVKTAATRAKIFHLALFIVVAVNTLAINNGRTGYAVFFALTALFLLRHVDRRWKLPSLGAAFLTIVAVLMLSPVSRDRLEETITNAETIHGKSPADHSSVVIRWQFLINSLAIIHKAPIIGHGTGSFEVQYAKQVSSTKQVGSSNPHNDYLLMLSQLGIAGLAVEVIFIMMLLRSSQSAEAPYRDILYALLVAFALFSALNSTLLDAGEGRFFLILFAILLSTDLPKNNDAKDR